MSPLSKKPASRGRQLANLRQGGNPAPPPAPPANDRARSHGAYAAVAADRLEGFEREVFDALAADAPLRDQGGALPPADGVVVRLLAETLIRLEDLKAYLRDRGLIDKKGNLRPAVEIESRLRREAADHADALGMTPRSRSKLGLDLARTADLASQWASEGESAEDAEPAIDAEVVDA